jgi:hypothetical protein
MRNYDTLLYLRMGLCPEEAHLERARRDAAERGWKLDVREGDLSLIAKLFRGPWDEDFLVVPPGRRIVARDDDRILEVEP